MHLSGARAEYLCSVSGLLSSGCEVNAGPQTEILSYSTFKGQPGLELSSTSQSQGLRNLSCLKNTTPVFLYFEMHRHAHTRLTVPLTPVVQLAGITRSSPCAALALLLSNCQVS